MFLLYFAAKNCEFPKKFYQSSVFKFRRSERSRPGSRALRPAGSTILLMKATPVPELHCLVAILLHFYDELRLAIHLHS
jgi:hypothetical protein